MKNKLTHLSATLLASSLALGATTVANAADTPYPANARPGECYARLDVPPRYETRTERREIQAAGYRVEVTPAVYQTVSERVLVQDAGQKYEVTDAAGQRLSASQKPIIRTRPDGTLEIIPRAFDTITQRVLVKEASVKVEAVPASYTTQTERVLVRPARTEWRSSKGGIYGLALVNGNNGAPVTRVNNQTGEVMCLVEIPAEYKTVSKRVLKTPATTRKVTIPAEYATVTKRVPKKLVVRAVPTAPKYDTVTKRVVKTPAQERRVATPAKFDTITRRVLVEQGRSEWVSVLCDVNVTRTKVREIQTALKRANYYRGPIDGIVGPATMKAIANFQKARGLVQAGITIESLRALNIAAR